MPSHQDAETLRPRCDRPFCHYEATSLGFGVGIITPPRAWNVGRRSFFICSKHWLCRKIKGGKSIVAISGFSALLFSMTATGKTAAAARAPSSARSSSRFIGGPRTRRISTRNCSSGSGDRLENPISRDVRDVGSSPLNVNGRKPAAFLRVFLSTNDIWNGGRRIWRS